MASPFETLVRNLDQLGFFGFILPWILTFAVFFALLLKSKALGEDQKIIGVISLVAAFFVIGFGGVGLGIFMKNLFGAGAMIMAGILVTLIFVALSGYDVSKLSDNKYVAIFVAAIGVILFFSLLGGARIISGEVMSIIFIVIVMIISVMFVASGS